MMEETNEVDSANASEQDTNKLEENHALEEEQKNELNQEQNCPTEEENLESKSHLKSKLPENVKPDVRIYLEEKVFPILTNGLEELLTAVDENKKKASEEENVPEIQPLYFLARYLMKNAPQQTKNSQKPQKNSSQNLSDSQTLGNLSGGEEIEDEEEKSVRTNDEKTE